MISLSKELERLARCKYEEECPKIKIYETENI